MIVERQWFDPEVLGANGLANLDYLCPRLWWFDTRLGKNVFAIEEQLRMGAQREPKSLALELGRTRERWRITVHGNPVALQPRINRLQSVRVRRAPAVEIVHNIETAVRGDADRSDFLLQ